MIARLAGSLLTALLIAGCFYLFTAKSLPFLAYQRTVVAADIQKHAAGPNSYLVNVPLDRAYPLMIVADGSTYGHTASNLQMFEDGKPLGPAHSGHFDIGIEGKGRFSHWGETSSDAVFSASDNSDPRTNGRVYTMIARPQVPPVVVLLVIPLFVILMQRLLSGPATRIVGVAATLLVLSAWLYAIGHFVQIAPDSFAYTSWSPLIPLGYPLFLSAVRSLAWVPTVQLVLLSAACLFVSLAANRLSKAAGIGVLFMLLSCSTVFFHSAGILSEGLLIPILLANVGAGLFLIFEQKRRWGIIVALTAALVMFIRPAGYFAPLGVIFLCLALPYPKRWAIKWCLLPFLAAFALTVAINGLVRGSTAQSQVGRILFPQVALIFEPTYAAPEDREMAEVIETALKPHQAKYRSATDLTSRFVFSYSNFNSWLSDSDAAVYARFVAIDTAAKGTADSSTFFRRIEALYVRLFWRTLWNDPVGYLRIVRDQMIGAWQGSILLYRAPVLALIKNEENSGSWKPAALKTWGVSLGSGQITPDTKRLESWAGSIIEFLDKVLTRIQKERWLVYVAGLASLIAIPLSLRSGASRHTIALGYCGALLHGSAFLTGTTTVFYYRYALPVDPVLLVAGVIAADAMVRAVARMARRELYPDPASSRSGALI
ncbi:MAG: Pectate lyase [Bradyrhizobium sp.]|nr:Pectate lyase [Bradyrhizobium sp.]